VRRRRGRRALAAKAHCRQFIVCGLGLTEVEGGATIFLQRQDKRGTFEVLEVGENGFAGHSHVDDVAGVT
jgi:hypothetical protein